MHDGTKIAATPGQANNHVDLAYEALEDMIVTMKLAPGARVVEASLSQRLEIGRTPLREAMLRLSSEMLLVAQPRRGMVVQELNFPFQMKVFETRRALESVLIPAAARRRTSEQAADLREISAQFRADLGSENPERLLRVDRDFVRRLVEMSGNPFLGQILPLYSLSRRFWLAYRPLFARRFRDETLTEFHIEICDAVAEGDDVRATRHVTNFLNFVEEYTLYVGKELV